MTNTRTRAPKLLALVVAALSAVLMVACGDFTPTEPMAQEASLADASAPNGVLATVKGGGHYSLKDPPTFVGNFKWIYRFSINARKNADGTDDGTVRFRSHQPPGQNDAGFPGGWDAEVIVDCVEVSGNTAWLSGPVVSSRTDSPFGPTVGGISLFIVRDNGPNGTDEVNVGPAAAFGATDCRDTPPVFPGAFADGNFTVTSY